MDANDYWYTWYPALFRTATRTLTTFQRGIYRELIDEYMETREPIPNTDIAILNIVKITAEEWDKEKHAILQFFEVEDGKLYHSFCNEILDKQDKLSKKRSKASKKAASSRWEHKRKLKMRNECETNAIDMRKNAIGKDRIGEEKSITKVIPKKKNKISKPENISGELWDDFLTLRKAKKAPVTKTVLNKIEKEADKINWTIEKAISEMCARGWQGFKAEWIVNEQKQQKGNSNGNNGNGRNRSYTDQDALAEVLAEIDERARKEQADILSGTAMLCDARELWEDTRSTENSYADDD